MQSVRCGVVAVPFMAASVALTGCPEWFDREAKLRVSATGHDFGLTETEWAFEVWRGSGLGRSTPFDVLVSKSWLSVDPTGGASAGTDERETIQVRVRRDLLRSEANRGIITVLWNAGSVQVVVTATGGGGEGEGEGEGEQASLVGQRGQAHPGGMPPTESRTR